MAYKKLKLEELKVQSFITSFLNGDQETIKGGSMFHCKPDKPDKPTDDGPATDTAGVYCIVPTADCIPSGQLLDCTMDQASEYFC